MRRFLFRNLLLLLVPVGLGAAEWNWTTYGKGPGNFTRDKSGVIRIRDNSPEQEYGIRTVLPIPQSGKYEVSCEVALPPGGNAAGNTKLFLVAGNQQAAAYFTGAENGRFKRYVAGIDIPAGVDKLQVYLYSSYKEKADFLVKNIRMIPVKEFSVPPGPLTPPSVASAAPAAVPGELRNPGLENRDDNGIPRFWQKYGQAPLPSPTPGPLLINDPDNQLENGIYQDISLPADGGNYLVTVTASLPDDDADPTGAYVQLRTQPDNQFRQAPLETGYRPGETAETKVGMTPAPGSRTMRVYIYTHKAESPRFLLHRVKLEKVDKLPETTSGLSPQFQQLKNLYLETPLRGTPIAPGDTPAARRAAEKIAARFGGPIVDPTTVKLPLEQHIIVVGARENNPLIARLYRRGFCYTDRVYPGPGGFEFRSIHNPTGGGFNVLLVGGSDEAGIEAATERLLAQQSDRTGFQMQISAPGFTKPFDAGDSNRYRLVGVGGYYGWNYIAGIMALFYQTGDEEYAREFLRLAFPDADAKKTFQKFNPESLENPDDPLAGPYHYCGHQMLLLWDLIEEHPFFSDADRLKVTNAFARQMRHPGIGGMYRRLSAPSLLPGSRHHQWANLCLYVLGRYFERDYPSPYWSSIRRSAEFAFGALNHPDGWIEGERGIISWFVSGAINPGAHFLQLADCPEFNPQGAWANALRFMATQWDGTPGSEVLGTASRQTFHMVADQTGDGQYLYYADLMGPESPGAKLGAAYGPTGKVVRRAPAELLNTWTCAPMSVAQRRFFNIKAPAEQCFLGLSYRDALGSNGDWISLNCFNEEYRTPFKLLSLYGLRLNGKNIFTGLGNYVQTYLDGTTTQHIPTLGTVERFGTAGDFAGFTGSVADHAFASWKRTLWLGKRRYALLADTLTPSPEAAGKTLTALINFQTPSGIRTVPQRPDTLRLSGSERVPVRTLQLSTRGGTYPISWGASNTLFETAAVGDRAVIGFDRDRAFSGTIELALMQHATRAGSIHVYLDGSKVAADIPHYSSGTDTRIVSFPAELAPGKHQLEIEVASLAPESTTAWIGAMSLAFVPAAARWTEIVSGGTEILQRGGDNAAAKVRLNRPQTIFTLVAEAGKETPLEVSPVGPHAALLRLPAPALTFTGAYPGVGQGDLLILEKDRISGCGVTELAGLFTSTAPVLLDWKADGSYEIHGIPKTEIQFAGQTLQLPESGRLPGTARTDEAFSRWRNLLQNLRPITNGTADRTFPAPEALAPRSIADFPENISWFRPDGDRLLAAAGSHLFELNRQGVRLRELILNAPVTAAVRQGDRLIAGCRDESVTAFDADGGKCWSFTSQLAPEVEASQKYYWFKGAYPGIFSLTADADRVYVGSACTMEEVDRQGKLMKRHAQTWGPARELALLPTPDGAVETVGLRHSAADGIYMWSVNSRNGANRPLFKDTLPGFKNFPAFGSMYRTHMEVADCDGDGKAELIADAQGMYLWMNVYDFRGQPKYQVNLGPGDKSMGRIFPCWRGGPFLPGGKWGAALISVNRELLALDGRLQPQWSRDLPFRPQHVAVLPDRVHVAGGRNYAIFDGSGNLLRYVTLPFAAVALAADSDRVLVSSGKTLYEIR